MAIRGLLYDGVTADRQEVEVEPFRLGIEIRRGEAARETVEASALQRLGRDREWLRIGRRDVAGWRLLVAPDDGPSLAHLLGNEERYGRWIDRIGFVPALAAFGAAAASIVAIGYLAPQWIAPHVPPSWERNLGSAIVGDFGDNRCRNAEGQRALEAMVERLSPGATKGPEPVRIAALDIGIFNAAALPGGHIVVFRDAITGTRDTDELAGIVAHEIAHVRRRHVTEALVRELGIGALIRLFAGDIGANAEQLVALSYTRENESEADADAIAMLRRAGISPKPTAALFERLAGEEGESGFGSEFLSSHPLTGGRARRFAKAYDPGAKYTPALTEAQSDALFNICWKPPAAEK